MDNQRKISKRLFVRKFFGYDEILEIILGIFLFTIVCAYFLYPQEQNGLKKENLDGHVLSSKIEYMKKYVYKSNNEATWEYQPIFYYEVDGNEYSCKSNRYYKKKLPKKNYKIYYDLNNPHVCISAKDKQKSITNFLSCVFGFVAILICFVLIKVAKIFI